MSFLYLTLLVGVGIVILGALVEAVVSVSRKPDWGSQRAALTVVPPVDSRSMDLPFVGAERRVPQGQHVHARDEVERDAA